MPVSATGMKFVGGGKKRFAGGDVDVDTWAELVVIFVGKWWLGGIVLRYVPLQRGELTAQGVVIRAAIGVDSLSFCPKWRATSKSCGLMWQ